MSSDDREDAPLNTRKTVKRGMFAGAATLFLFQCVGPAPTSKVRMLLWNQSDSGLQERLARHLMTEITGKRSDGADSVILIGEPVPDCAQQLTGAGFELIGDVEEGDVYRLDRMSFMPLIERNFIVTCGPDQVRVSVGLTGL